MSKAIGIVVVLTVAVDSFAGEANVLLKERRVKSPAEIELAFELPEIPRGRQVRLGLDVRMDSPAFRGLAHSLRIWVNEKLVDLPELINKRPFFVLRNSQDYLWVWGGYAGYWHVFFSPDFSDRIRTEPVPFGTPQDDPYRFVFDVSKFVTPGKNSVRFELLGTDRVFVLRDVKTEVGKPLAIPAAAKARPTPAGPVPTYVMKGPRPVAMRVRLSQRGDMLLETAGRRFAVSSRTSEPDGRWATSSGGGGKAIGRGESATAAWQGTGYTVSRKVTVCDDRVLVADTIANTGKQLVGVIYENRVALPDTPSETRLAGHPTYAKTQQVPEPLHPTAIAVWDDFALGLVAEGDIFRVHNSSFVEPNVIGLADRKLGIPPGTSHTLEWSIYPIPNGDYWDFINAIRRNWNSNFELHGMVFPWTWTDLKFNDPLKRQREYITSRGVKWLCSGQTTYRNGTMAHGTGIPFAVKWYRKWIHAVKKAHAIGESYRPIIYLNTQICLEPGNQALYADSKHMDASGKHLDYGIPYYVYLVTRDNSYGQALMKTIAEILDDTGCDGFYMDGWSWERTRWAWHTTWDNCTLDIDPKTHVVKGKYSSTILLQQDWKLQFVKYLRRRGKVIIGNGGAHTRTIQQLQVPSFTEGWSTSKVVEQHLDSPLSLGGWDQSGNDPARIRMARRILDHGGLLVVWTWPDTPKNQPHFASLMYPITPVELYAGVVLGEERIITNRSGRFGWPDGSAADVYVYDAEAKLVASPLVKWIHQDGKLITELRMPGDHLAILVKKR